MSEKQAKELHEYTIKDLEKALEIRKDELRKEEAKEVAEHILANLDDVTEVSVRADTIEATAIGDDNPHYIPTNRKTITIELNGGA